MIHHILGHLAVRGQLATGDRHQPILAFDDFVRARELARRLMLFQLQQRAVACVRRDDISNGDRLAQVAVEVLEQVRDIILPSDGWGIQRCFGIGGADERAREPRDDKDDATVVGLR